MLVSEQNPSSDLTIFIKRAKIVNDKELSIIPDPVYEPNYEKNIDRETAISFQVKEGDLAVFLQAGAYEVLYQGDKYFIVSQSSILMIERDDSLFN